MSGLQVILLLCTAFSAHETLRCVFALFRGKQVKEIIIGFGPKLMNVFAEDLVISLHALPLCTCVVLEGEQDYAGMPLPVKVYKVFSDTVSCARKSKR